MAHFNQLNSFSGKFFAMTGALALCMSTGTSALAMGQAIADGNGGAERVMNTSITTTVDNTATDLDPDGTCEECWATVTGNSSGSEASVVMFFKDDGEDFAGDLELEVSFTAGGSDTVYIYDTEISHASSRTYTVSDNPNWNWNDVSSVTITVIQ